MQYSAMLRLPGSMSSKEKKKIVDEIVEALDMRKCMHTGKKSQFKGHRDEKCHLRDEKCK